MDRCFYLELDCFQRQIQCFFALQASHSFLIYLRVTEDYFVDYCLETLLTS